MDYQTFKQKILKEMIENNSIKTETLYPALLRKIDRYAKANSLSSIETNPLKHSLRRAYFIRIFNNWIEDTTLYIIKDSAEFMTRKPRATSMDDCTRYLMNRKELELFLTEFKKKGGDLKTIHIGIVYDEGEFHSYEIVRSEIWNDFFLRRKYCYAERDVRY